jgi:hypothetical protein
MSPAKGTPHPHHSKTSPASSPPLPAYLCAILLTIMLTGCANSHNTTTASAPTSTSTSTSSTATGTSTTSSTGPPLPAGVIAQVGRYTITKPILGQWMTETIATDFYTIAGYRVPLGLVTEPANYPACLSQLTKLTPTAGQGLPRPTTAQLLTKCHRLYTTIKNQALEYLVSAYWSKNYDTAHAIHITPTETQQELKHIQTSTKPSTYLQTLTNNRRSPTQELFIIENQLLNNKTANKLLHANKQALARFNQEAEHTENNANCRPGYTVAHCKNYRPATQPTTPPNQPLEEITHWHPQTTHNHTNTPTTN